MRRGVQIIFSVRMCVCTCAVIGCPRLVLSDGAWIKSVGNHGDDVMVRCNDTLETWYLSCQGNQWIGYYDNCTSTRRSPVDRRFYTLAMQICTAVGEL